MTFKTLIAASLIAVTPALVAAETHEVQMLNRGEAGAMVFEPRFVAAEVGDTVKFVPTDKGHNAESTDGMVPEGQDEFASKINEEIEIELTSEGVLGVNCKPHFGMGMVMVVQTGDAEVPEGFLDTKMPKRAKQMYEEILSENGLN